MRRSKHLLEVLQSEEIGKFITDTYEGAVGTDEIIVNTREDSVSGKW